MSIMRLKVGRYGCARALMILVATAVASPAYSENNMAGYGTIPCCEVLTYLPTAEFRSRLMAWTTGFFTGANMVTTASRGVYRDLSNLDPDAIAAQILIFCKSNPETPVIGAVEPLFASFGTLRWEANR
jgi:hypothetical protein